MADHLEPVSESASSASGPGTLNDVSEQNSVSLQVAFDFNESGDAVLNARAGEIAVALKLRFVLRCVSVLVDLPAHIVCHREDWLNDRDAWVWVRIDDVEGCAVALPLRFMSRVFI